MEAVFYNTIQADGQMLIKFEDRAAKQDAVILEYFERRPYDNFTPWEVWSYLNGIGFNYPITSVRRAINTLTKKRNLRKLDGIQRPGEFDTPNNTWQYNASEQERH